MRLFFPRYSASALVWNLMAVKKKIVLRFTIWRMSESQFCCSSLILVELRIPLYSRLMRIPSLLFSRTFDSKYSMLVGKNRCFGVLELNKEGLSCTSERIMCWVAKSHHHLYYACSLLDSKYQHFSHLTILALLCGGTHGDIHACPSAFYYSALFSQFAQWRQVGGVTINSTNHPLGDDGGGVCALYE